ncbi:MAG: carboxymuconolactone decarboxylase family protein [Thauera sp.]|nr:carboxymuconolactone decarboxylase family protein [Thauera sp.]
MSRLPLQTPETAPEDSKPFVAKALANNGFLPNLIGVLANAPVAVETYLTVSAINGRAALPLAEREVVQLTAASVHGCDFCLSGHTAIVMKKVGMEAARALQLQRGEPTDDARLNAVQDFTKAVIASRGAVSDEALAAFKAAGYTDQHALEVVLGVSLATLCNFANNLAKPAINPELQAFAPGVFQA